MDIIAQEASTLGHDQLNRTQQTQDTNYVSRKVIDCSDELKGFQPQNNLRHKVSPSYSTDHHASYHSNPMLASTVGNETLPTYQSRHQDYPQVNSNFSTQRQNKIISPDSTKLR